ncbi:MAG TPA: hypothetical protein VFL29_09080, partial [Candidatus Dormibacteraeota bacterium]|nr:hypothetical protein [Candidatus Dormibacteraeota bacterium]
MTSFLAFMQDLVAVAFLALGVATAAIWFRRRDRSSGLLALAIILLSLEVAFSRMTQLLHITSPVLSVVNLLAFIGSGYALFSYRASIIPLSRKWRVGAASVLGAAVVAYVVATALSARPTVLLWIALGLLAAWAVVVLEPIIRFFLVARGLPAVQAWRLRSLSLGFAGLVAIIAFLLALVAAGTKKIDPAVTAGIEVVVLAIVPLLYVSFAPPAWLRREWRASEEEG